MLNEQYIKAADVSLRHQFSKLRETATVTMIFKSVILLALVAMAVAQRTSGAQRQTAGTQSTTPIPIVRQQMEVANGSFKSSFETGNGIKVEESGTQKKVGPKPEDIGTVSSGSYSYTSPDGAVITVNWVADENGFQATGDHLPTPPPMPEHVVKLLADLRAAGAL